MSSCVICLVIAREIFLLQSDCSSITKTSRDTFQPMRRRACVYQQTNQNIAPVIKNFQNSGRSRTELKMCLQYLSRFHM